MAGLDRRQGAETLPRSGLDVEQEMWLESRMDALHVGCANHSVPAPVPTFEHSLA